PAGVAHSVAWNTVADIGSVRAGDVTITATPVDRATGVAATGSSASLGPITIANNAAPVAFIPAPPRQSGAIAAGYTLPDRGSDATDVAAEYSIDHGAPFATAHATSGSEALTGRATSPAGVAHVFTWDSAADLGA